MQPITDFDKDVDKQRVLGIIGFTKAMETYDEVCEIYEEVLKKSLQIVNPIGLYGIFPSEEFQFENILKEYGMVACVVVSIGGRISEQISQYFDEGNYVEGMILDAISSSLVHKVRERVVEALSKELSSKNWGTTKCFSPGQDLPLSFQTEIVGKLSGGTYSISTTTSHIIKPLKSISFIVGLSPDLPTINLKHDCSACTQKNCKWRSESYEYV